MEQVVDGILHIPPVPRPGRDDSCPYPRPISGRGADNYREGVCLN